MSGAAMWPRAATCPRCGESALQRWRHERVGSRHCQVPKEWARNFMSGAIMVRAEMALALREGRLEHYSKFQCVDCGAPAECYDHRDYSKPLDVDPVCRGCNVRRGAAKPKAWTLTEALEAFDSYQSAAPWCANAARGCG